MKKPYKFTLSKKKWKEAQTIVAGGSQGTRTPMYSDFPIYFTKASGCRMWDADGNEFIDLLCSIGPVLLGYAYKPVDDAVRAMLKDSFQSSMNHPIQLELGKLLIDIIPCAERVRFLKTGTEATQAAIRVARLVTNRTWVARHGYHGWADMWWYGRTEGIHKAAWEVIPSFDGTAEGLESLFKKTKEKFAAVILCPADTKPFTKENFQAIIDVAHKHGALVIFDEIKTGFRSALGGVQELFGLCPDLTTLSKGMGNGYPISAVVGQAKYMDQIVRTPIAGTFSVEALSLAASLATIRELKEKKVAEHLWKVGQRFIDGLNQICRNHGLEEPQAYADPIPSMPRFSWNPAQEESNMSHPAAKYFFSECYKYGLFFSPWHVSFVNYSHKNKDIDQALDICDFIMARTKKNWRKIMQGS
jgi:glutamate-1-semialdehyde aminotransferase